MSIPNIIHYCWFGNKPLPKSCRRMIESWKTYLPDHEIMLWNEKTFDVTRSKYVRDAYEAGKFAFVSDYARLYALKTYGGIYFDTDIEVIRGFGGLLEGYGAVFGFESGEKVMTAFMAARPEDPIISEFLDSYADRAFDPGHLEPNTVALTRILERRGLVPNNQMQLLGPDTVVYPLEYFQAYDFTKASLRITDDTVTIHRCFGSWCSVRERLLFRAKRSLGRLLPEKGYERLKLLKKKLMGK